ncbi:hypothetical protein DVW87_08730 [Sphingomonas aracearum]|uniref:Uncharacterized protein n=2 Tax=Sphingomonas aracearum TaxID=2283317 RepID=A0A369VZT8_9SPHN|nr:hypothetical protein DVW87_08730 [Sphingomonas aracearum]
MRVIVGIGAACLASAGGAQTLVSKQAQLSQLGTCLVSQAPALSNKLLRAPFGAPGERDAATTLVRGHRHCIRGYSVSGHTGEIRGAVAEAMFLRQPGLLDTLATRASVPAVRPAEKAGRAFLVGYAKCLVAARPKETVAFLRSPVQTVGEKQAFLGFGDGLKTCMPEGAEYKVDITDLRNHIAAVAYMAVALSDAK